MNSAHSRDQGEAAVYLRLWFRGTPWDCLLDTGCEHSVIPKKMIGRARIDDSNEKLYAANGTVIGTLGTVDIVLHLNGMPLNVHALVTEHISEPMLGVDWLKENGCSWNFVNDTIAIQGQAYPLISRAPRRWCRRIVIERRAEVPAESQSFVCGRVEMDSLRGCDGASWCTEPGEVQNGLCVARALLPDRLCDLPVQVMNVTKNCIVLDVGTAITDLSPVEVSHKGGERSQLRSDLGVVGGPVGEGQRWCRAVEGNEGQVEGVNEDEGDLGELKGMELGFEGVASVVDKYDPQLLLKGMSPGVSVSEREQISALLSEFSDVFSKNELDLGETHLGVHRIDTGDARPIRQQMRRHPRQQLDTIDEQVDKLI